MMAKHKVTPIIILALVTLCAGWETAMYAVIHSN